MDLISAAGGLSALEQEYSRADDYYDVAAQRYGKAAAESHLLREVPGNLLWQVARRLRLTDPRADQSRLVLLTRGALAAHPGESVTDLLGSPPTAPKEFPARAGFLIPGSAPAYCAGPWLLRWRRRWWRPASTLPA